MKSIVTLTGNRRSISLREAREITEPPGQDRAELSPVGHRRCAPGLKKWRGPLFDLQRITSNCSLKG